MEQTLVQAAIVKKCEEVKELLLEKNRKYGNSALEPINIFFQGSALTGIKVRIDDKLKRLKNMQRPEDVDAFLDDEDTIMDLIGYLILYRIGKELQL